MDEEIQKKEVILGELLSKVGNLSKEISSDQREQIEEMIDELKTETER